jgi:hypothetical protein
MLRTKVVQKIKPHILCSKPSFKSRAVYNIMCKNIAEPERPGMIMIYRMHIACWIPKATDTHSEYVILIVFLRQLLYEHA